MKLWIARDKEGPLWLFENKPIFNESSNEFFCKYGEINIQLDSQLLPEVTFENSPQQIEFKLIKEN